ncbi:MAG TPA: hypothetical protein VHU23_10625 [Rhizomicrobium sp.]|nr:hypothetical protein [Rhizomicrobium sp.]
MFRDAPGPISPTLYRRAILCALAAGLVPGPPAIAKHQITKFEIQGATNIFQTSIANGVIAGTYTDALHTPSGFIRTPDGRITTFDVPGGGGTQVSNINDEGTITGDYFGSEAKGNDGNYGKGGKSAIRNNVYIVTHGFVREANGKFIRFDVPGSGFTDAVAINDRGAIAGDYLDGSEAIHGYMRAANGVFVHFNPAGSAETWPKSINRSGAITGWYVDRAGIQHGFVRAADHKITIFDPPGATSTDPCSINEFGVITGWYQSGAVYHGFVRGSDGTITAFDPAGAIGTAPCCIDKLGRITGNYFDSSDVEHAFIRSKSGNITTFDVRGASGTAPSGIDSNPGDSGAIAGQYSVGDTYYGFLRSR